MPIHKAPKRKFAKKQPQLSFINSEIIVPNLKKAIFATKKF